MVLPAEYAWLEPVLVAAVVVFVIDLIGNSIRLATVSPMLLQPRSCSP